MTNAVLDAIRSRRLVRAMTDEPLDRASAETVLEAGGGHRRRGIGTSNGSWPRPIPARCGCCGWCLQG
jgi:hypothetical protein